MKCTHIGAPDEPYGPVDFCQQKADFMCQDWNGAYILPRCSEHAAVFPHKREIKADDDRLASY